MAKLTHRKLNLTEAQEFVAAHHRHSEPLKRHVFSTGAHRPGFRHPLLGVATVDSCSSSWSKRLDHVELRRLCTTGEPNVASYLLGRVKTACFAIGYNCIVTYTQPYERGGSLKAAGFWVQRVKSNGLVQWIAARSYQPDQQERDFTNRALERVNDAWARMHESN